MSRVLMVDSPALFRMLDASFVRRAGWEIVAGRHADDIVGKARTHAPDLVLLDAALAGFDAPGCVGGLKSDPTARAVPVLVLAGSAEARRCEEAGADATLAHPVAPAALEAALCALARVPARAGRRRPARIPVRLALPSGTVRARLKDISLSGAFVALPSVPQLTAPVELALRLPVPEGAAEVQARGIVVRRVEDDPRSHLVAGVGIRFTGVDAASGSIIDRFVNLEVVDPEDGGDAGSGDMP
jgi:CheY-like chemotaxis protein